MRFFKNSCAGTRTGASPAFGGGYAKQIPFLKNKDLSICRHRNDYVVKTIIPPQEHKTVVIESKDLGHRVNKDSSPQSPNYNAQKPQELELVKMELMKPFFSF